MGCCNNHFISFKIQKCKFSLHFYLFFGFNISYLYFNINYWFIVIHIGHELFSSISTFLADLWREKKLPPRIVIQQKGIANGIVGVLSHEYSHARNDLKIDSRNGCCAFFISLNSFPKVKFPERELTSGDTLRVL